MTNEAKLRHILVAKALQYLNWSEINGQDDLIIDKYNAIRTPRYKMNHQDSWCAAFVSVVKHEAGFDALIPTECGCEEMIRLFQAMGRYEEDGRITPREGDYIFYNWDDNTQPNDGWADHVGIVVSVTGNNIKVIEGNASDRVKYHDIPIGWGNIRGYGLPDFASISKEVPEDKEYDGPSIVSYLNSIGKDSSYFARELLAIEHGIKGYKGTADQNLLLLKLLKVGVAPVQPVPPPPPIPQPAPSDSIIKNARVGSWQNAMNAGFDLDEENKLKVDNSFGPKSQALATKHQMHRYIKGCPTAIKWLQNRLKELGFYSGRIDGKFEDGTYDAVVALEKARGLTPSGWVGVKVTTELLK